MATRFYYTCMTAASDPTYFQQRAGCYDYVVGVSDMILDFPAISGIKPTVCYPNGVTAGQIVDVAVQYLASHPQERHYTASSTVLRALRQAFPCDH